MSSTSRSLQLLDQAPPAAASVLATLLSAGPLSRVELARRLGLSSAAVTKAARPFLDDGYLHELASERTAPGAGRPVSPLAVTPDREFFVGMKITDTGLYGVLCDLHAQVRSSRRTRLPDLQPATVQRALAVMVDDLLDGPLDVRGGAAAPQSSGPRPPVRERTHQLGIAVSGDVDRGTGRVRRSGRLGWHGVDLGALAAEATGLTVTVENDVKALAVAEHWFGEGAGTDYFALVTVGAGIGSALVVNGRLLAGAYGVAGELGHLSVDPDGPRCHCGARGCVEAIASTGAVLAGAREATGRAELTIEEAVGLARAGDPVVRELFARAGRAIGTGVASLVNIVGPERIVISGEGVEVNDLFEAELREAFAEHCFGAAADCPLTLRPLPFEAWARGAAAVGIQSLFAAGRVATRPHPVLA
ncbi:putative NBD/HSP70 family sugar kinase [Streptacidiphilus sp. MAP12-33]|uniref:ROK family transcriptional regulator n=1 Tax=Streptacidiphilus sp. MAP12-33 TaxID=3156266 RepID=UPI003512E860